MKSIYSTAAFFAASTILLLIGLMGCENSVQSPNTSELSENILHYSTGVSDICGEIVTFDLLAGADQTKVGTVKVWNDEEDLYVKFILDEEYEGLLGDTHLHVSCDEPEERGAPGQYNLNGYLVFSNDTKALYKIPLSEEILQCPCPPEEESCDWCFYLKTHAVVDGETAFAGEFVQPEQGSWFNFLEYCIQECNGNGEPEVACETAWGYGEGIAYPNNEVEYNGVVNPSEAWGWTNLLDLAGFTDPVVLDLYAGAGLNDLSKGELVGTVTVDYDGNFLTVTYELDEAFEDCWFSEMHLWVGETELPLELRGRHQVETPTAAPGLFNYTDMDDHPFIVDVSGLDEVWVAAHAVVCCEIGE
jgi:hypothetical protein